MDNDKETPEANEAPMPAWLNAWAPFHRYFTLAMIGVGFAGLITDKMWMCVLAFIGGGIGAFIGGALASRFPQEEEQVQPRGYDWNAFYAGRNSRTSLDRWP